MQVFLTEMNLQIFETNRGNSDGKSKNASSQSISTHYGNFA